VKKRERASAVHCLDLLHPRRQKPLSGMKYMGQKERERKRERERERAGAPRDNSELCLSSSLGPALPALVALRPLSSSRDRARSLAILPRPPIRSRVRSRCLMRRAVDPRSALARFSPTAVNSRGEDRYRNDDKHEYLRRPDTRVCTDLCSEASFLRDRARCSALPRDKGTDWKSRGKSCRGRDDLVRRSRNRSASSAFSRDLFEFFR